MTKMLELRLLGRLDLQRNGAPVAEIQANKTLALLSYLVVTARPHTRPALAGLLWGGMPEAKARGNLSKALSTLRRVVGDHLTITRRTVTFNEESDFRLDAAEFEAGVSHSSIERLQQAVQLYEGDFLEGFSIRNSPEFEDWVLAQQARLKELALRALHTLAAHFAEQDAAGRAKAIEYTRRLLTMEPWREEAHRQMMRLLILNGQRGAALAQYETCRQVLTDELGVEPGAETTALYEQIRDGELSRGAEGQGSRGAGEQYLIQNPKTKIQNRHNLPPQPTPFIGREQEMAALDELVATPDVRLLTVLGLGGMGKTRLALEMGADQLPRFDQGVYFVPLAAIDQTEDIVPAIAEALDFSFYEGGAPQQQILDYLREKEMLLILDNVEHLLNDSESGDGVSQLITTILRTAPNVKIIATSRERLKLQEEQRFPIKGIDVPTFDGTDDAAAYGAIRLFEQSARRAQPDFELTGENVQFVVHICQLVEGMPLAILLAAAWVELLSPQDIATEISRSLDFLETGLRNIPARQSSMRAVFDHSWQLLTEQEQAVFQQIAIFRGGFTKAAVQAVTGTSLHVLMALVNKSLIYRGEEDRYDIHELLRQFAAEKLAKQGLESAARNRHSAYYCAFLHQQEDDLKGARHQTALTEIEAELENIKTAWNWAVGQGYVEHLGQAIFSLADFYYWRVRWQEGEGLCRLAAESLASITSEDGIRVRAKALTEQSRFNFMLGRFTVARECQRQSLILLDGLAAAGQDVRTEKAYTLWIMGETEWYNPAKAVALFKEGLALNKPLGNDWLTAQLLRELGNSTTISSNFDQAQALIEESLTICQTLGYRQGMASALTCLAYNALPQGQFEESARLAREILKIEREFGDRRSLAQGFLSAGMILTWAGEFAAGQTMLAECLPIYRSQGARSNVALVQAWLGYGNCHLGDYEQARSQIEHALALYREIGQQEAITRWFLSQTLLALDRYDEALVILQKSVPEFDETGQRNELGLVLGTLGYALYKLGNLSQTRKHLAEALRLGTESRAFMPLYAALPVISLILADQGEMERAVELYALISRYPPVAKSRWFADTFGQHIEAVAATLPPGVAAAAQTRGRSREIWEAAEALLSNINLELISSATPPPVHNLPLQPTPFIGREEELAEITQRLTDPDCRLLTLVGPGGIGKTRLAIEAAERLLPNEVFPGGIYFVPLAALNSTDFLVSTLADPLKFSFQGDADPKVQLLNFLAKMKQAMLLVLDNFEQLVEGAELLATILQQAPVVKLLVTSRERLNLREEWVLDIMGLPSPTSVQPVEGVEAYSAVQLFLQMATRLDATFTLSIADIPHLVHICRLVEGMPLGLELAAAWVRVLSCQEIAREIEESLEFLATSLRDVPARHRSLAAVFDHSWNHLSSEEQRVFRSLTVFRGGFSREAAEQVAGASLPLLAALVDKSMLRRNDSGRYELHELLRQYGSEKLQEAGNTESARDRHLAFFLKLAEEVEPHLAGSEQVRWLNQLDLEYNNLRAALDWSRTAEGATEFGLRLAGSLAIFWDTRSYFSEGVAYLLAALSKPESQERTAVRAKALHKIAGLAFELGDFTRVRVWLEESQSINRELGPAGKSGLAHALIMLGVTDAEEGNYVAAISLQQEALVILREMKDSIGTARALRMLGWCALRTGAYEQATDYFTEALPITRQIGERFNEAQALSGLGETVLRQGDTKRATKLLEAALQLNREVGSRWGIAAMLGSLGWVALLQGNLRRAVTLLKESLILRQEIGDRAGGIAWCLEKLAEVALLSGQQDLSSRREAEFRRSAQLFGAAEALRISSGSPIDLADRPEYERQIGMVQVQLDKEIFAVAWAEGQEITMEQAVDYALAVEPISSQ